MGVTEKSRQRRRVVLKEDSATTGIPPEARITDFSPDVARRILPVASRYRPKPSFPVVKVCQDPKLWGPWFEEQGDEWFGWFVFLKSVFGERLKADELQFFQEITGRTGPPSGEVREVWMAVGRRGGKSRMMALMAVYLAAFYDWTPFLSPGEVGTVMVVAQNRRQARNIFRYIEAFINEVPFLKKMLIKETQEVFELNNRTVIEIHTASFRGIRGYTMVAAVLDEIAFWRSDDSANPDYEILEALRPAMTTIPGAMIVAASSPYAKRGELWENYKRHYGKDESDEILVFQAPTWVMNPTVPYSVLERAYQRDRTSAEAEYGANFRTDVEAFLTEEQLDAVMIPGRFELPPVAGIRYRGFVDPSGGSSDSMTLGISHEEGTKRVLDLVREIRPPFSPDSVVEDFCSDLKRYNINQVVGDRYGGEWPRERFSAHGITYVVCGHVKSEIYKEFLPLVTTSEVELLDSDAMKIQFLNLERRTARSGRDTIDHARGVHDDIANVVAGAMIEARVAEPLRVW